MTSMKAQKTLKRSLRADQDDEMYREYRNKLRKADNSHENNNQIPRILNNNNVSDSRLVNGLGTKQRKLILHFDLRNTVLISDSVTNVSVEQALNSFLTGVVWLNEVDGRLVWASEEPSLKPPVPGCNTYYKHLEKIYLQNPSADRVRTKLRLATGDFTHTEVGQKFKDYFEKHLEHLKWKHHFVKDSMDDILTNDGLDGTQYHYVLKSFYKLLYHLREEKRDFAVVFRTYGLDAENVLKSVNYGISGGHPDFPKKLNMEVDLCPGNIKRSENGPFVLECSKTKDTNNVPQSDRDVYNFFSKSTGISGFKDDFIYWQDHKYNFQTAKPLFIDLNDHQFHHIMFDDNFRSYEDDSIINLRLLEDAKNVNSKSASRDLIAEFENVCLIQADAMSAIEFDDYYINQVKLCEKNYENCIQSHRK